MMGHDNSMRQKCGFMVLVTPYIIMVEAAGIEPASLDRSI